MNMQINSRAICLTFEFVPKTYEFVAMQILGSLSVLLLALVGNRNGGKSWPKSLQGC